MSAKWRPRALEAALLWNPRAKLKVALLWSPAEALERSLVRKGVSRSKALYFSRMLSAFMDHILAILPITIMLICVMKIYFDRKPNNPGELAFGTVCAIFGLTFFSDALRVVVMPFAEHLGSKLPLKVPTAVTLMIAFALGVLCTYAEPAIASLVPLAQMVSRSQSPYLHLMLNDFRELLIGAVCIGVGSAAVLGTMRFMYDWTMKSLIFATITPTLALACYMHWGDPRLRPLLGLAWDCGAVTTGDVTVPTLLAFGMGAMKAEKKKRSERTGQPIPPAKDFEGFGLVTLASILPILTVEILAIICAQYISPEELVARDWQPEPETVLDTTPVTEILYAMRAMLPLNAALILAVLIFLREPLPLLPLFPLEEENHLPPVSPNSVDATLADPLSPVLKAVPENPQSPTREEPTNWIRNALVAFLGVLLGQIGIMLFFVGLSYAFSSLGNEVGQLLPASFLRVPQEASSPFFSYSGGAVLTLSTVGILGFLSTRAEPALNVVGLTVEQVSGGTFPAGLLIYSVCVGVGAGMVMGSTKMLFGVPMIIWILTKYGVALLFTMMASDNMASMAWDSAGVTTGSVTVPFVLSIGIGFSEATFAADGFGILTSASAAPIITVLAVDFFRSRLRPQKTSKNAPAPESTKLSNQEDSNMLTVNQNSLYQGGSQVELESLVPQKDLRVLKTNQFKPTVSFDSLGVERAGLARDASQTNLDVPEGESLIGHKDARTLEKPRMRLAASNESSIPEEQVPLTTLNANEKRDFPSELESLVPEQPLISPALVTIHSPTNHLESSEEMTPLVITIKPTEVGASVGEEG